MPVALKGATSGQVTLNVPAVAGTNTLTLPAVTGNVITSADTATVTQAMMAAGVAGNGPSFSVYSSVAQTISTATKIQFNVEEWDTANCFDNTTNYRFTPNVAGYYQINCFVRANNNAQQFTMLYKNGLNYRDVLGSTAIFGLPLSTMVFCNGTTDYLEIYFSSSVSINTVPSSSDVWFNGFLARSA